MPKTAQQTCTWTFGDITCPNKATHILTVVDANGVATTANYCQIHWRAYLGTV